MELHLSGVFEAQGQRRAGLARPRPSAAALPC